jgi:peptide/nickel transport system substrate-binding protein
MKAPFCMSYRGGRPTADQALSVAYASNASQNDTHWKSADFDAKLLEARAMLDQAKRKEIYAELQAMISNDGGALIPMFGDYLDATSKKLKGVTTHPMFNLMGARLAEKVWLEA